jgi:membrane protease YdiL (CAAX protease family)
LLAFPLALLPSVALLVGVYTLLRGVGVNTSELNAPNIEPTLVEFIGTVVFAPLVETLLLAGLIRALSSLTANTPLIAVVSALLWGALHATRGPLWFFGTAWSFFVFSCVFLAWRRVSFKRAYTVALVPHVLINLTAMLFLAANEESPNPSIERTSSSKLRLLPAAAHVER